ncbi:ABC transporter ATP-binding protein [Robertkochia solimangrovi]|uniref:ABC transporter ATP-binding protein n=1 Tax=Robertkochia solimangrovi TaxID=2213046 RepID=UPI00117BE573|nr:ATP-binding cassette domain-containing protein [Robertkochia solimangrovi]TRZ42858.1 ABC transporter ATP-binding protein [Robertkochia solimangrovi]
MIEVQNLNFRYKKDSRILNFPNITLNNSESLLILGRSGVGKTTLLHLLSGLLSPYHGAVVVDDVAIHELSPKRLDAFRGHHIGIIFQRNHAISTLTVEENLRARLFFSGRAINTVVIQQLLESLNIADCISHRTNELSEGQLQRLGIAMAVIHSPRVILADEPTSSLDDENCMKVIDLLKKQAELNDANLVVITHDQRITAHFSKTIFL